MNQYLKLWICWSLFFLSCGSSVPELVTPPQLVLNPNETAPLVTYLNFTADEPVRAVIEIFDGEKKRWLYQPQGLFKQEHAIPLFQFNPGKTYEIKLRMRDTRNKVSKETKVISYATPELPDDFPKLKILMTQADQREPGYTVFSLAYRDAEKNAYLIALNRMGEVAWFFRHPWIQGQLRRLNNGNILVNTAKDKIIELDLTGKTIREYSGVDLDEGRSLFSKIEGALFDSDINTFSLKLIQSGNILTANSEEAKDREYSFSKISEWTVGKEQKIFELELAQEVQLLGILHLPDLLVKLEGE